MDFDTIIQADCIKWLQEQSEPFADLIFADPPFNIGYDYDVYEDRRAYLDYRKWTIQWMKACKRVLRPTGSFWIAIGDDYAAEVRMIGRKLGLHLRNWVIWHYTFGQQTKAKFARSHTHLFYFVNDPKEFTFNDKAVRTFSDRQREYNDKRANAEGKMPDDVWADFPRVCGTFEERVQWHPCQMPESILARIIRVSSNSASMVEGKQKPADVVFDPFSGSGTTLAVAKKLSRRFIGTELSRNYVQQIKKRLQGITPMANVEGEGTEAWPDDHVQELKGLYLEARVPTDAMAKKAQLLQAFAQQLNWRLEKSGCDHTYTVEEVWDKLERLRKQGKLGRIRVHADEDPSGVIRSAPKLIPDIEGEQKG